MRRRDSHPSEPPTNPNAIYVRLGMTKGALVAVAILTVAVIVAFVLVDRQNNRTNRLARDAKVTSLQTQATIVALKKEIAERRKLGRTTILDICRRTNLGFEKFAAPIIAQLQQAIRDTQRINKPGGIQLPTVTEADKRRAIANDLKLIAALRLHPLGNCLKLPTVAHTPPEKPSS